MKLSVLAGVSVLFVLSTAAAAAEPVGPVSLLRSNGDVLIENMGLSLAARLKVISLGTNVDYRVACQVFYCDESLSADDDEAFLKDSYVNQALMLFLRDLCAGMSPEEIVAEYRSGLMSLYLEDFRLLVNEELSDLGIDVVGVSMRAVGEFAARVAE